MARGAFPPRNGDSALGVDLGTSALRIALPGYGVVLDVPALIAQDARTAEVVAWGAGVRGRDRGLLDPDAGVPEGSADVVIRRPVRNGGLADLPCAVALFRRAFAAVCDGRLGRRLPPVAASYAGTARDFEQRALVAAFRAAGADRVGLHAAARAAVAGSGFPLGRSGASFVVSLGAGATDIRAMWNGELVVQRALRLGGEDLDGPIVRLVRREYRLAIGSATAEAIKQQVGVTGLDNTGARVTVTGHDLCRGRPAAVEVPVADLRLALARPVREIGDAVRAALEAVPAGLAAGVAERGLVLVGGGARLRGLPGYLTEVTDLPVVVADAPETCVVRGLAGCPHDAVARDAVGLGARRWHGLAV